MEKQQKKQVKKYISWGLIVALVALLAFLPLIAAGNEAVDGPQASILSGTVTQADIAHTIVGGGTLTGEDAVEVTIPSQVKLTGYLVKNGDAVEEGDVIATVDRVTVMTAITQVQETLEYLAGEMEEIRDEKASDTVTALAGGTVKRLYAQEGQSVPDVMLEHGALAVLSLDGLMAVQMTVDTPLTTGETVLVTLSDGTQTEGTVESNLGGVLTVTVEDDGYAVGEPVSVATEAGSGIGSGTLYIHSQWNAVAYAGTISGIYISEGDTVSSGRTLMTLEDTGHTAQYDQLAAQHREYEKMMLTLFQMYQSECITAPCAGIVSGVDETGAYLLANNGGSWQLTFLSNAPNGDDETSYINYVGRVISVGIDGLVLQVNPQYLTITDYKDLSGVSTDSASMTQSVIYTAQAPVYELINGQWTQIDAAAITAGDVLLFAGDANGNFVWVVRVARGTAVPEEPDSGDDTDPVAPTDPETPSDQQQPSEPSDATDSMDSATTQPGSGISQSGSGFGYSGGGIQQEEETELYGLDTVSIASVTAQERMTLEITVDELDISSVFVGQPADITVDALNGEKFTAAVTQIADSGENDGGNSKFTVELTLDKRGDMLPGMNASVVITLETATDCLSVPVAALTESGTQTVLYTGYDEETGVLSDPVTVTVGISDGENVQILSGIGEGETYYYPYYDTLVISDAPDTGRFSFGR